MAGTAKGSHRLDRRREDEAVELFRQISTFDAVLARLQRDVAVLAAIAAAIVVAYVGYVGTAFVAEPADAGVLREPYLAAPVFIRRDARDVAHVEARSERDAFFAQGFVEATDRLFQMELTRRYALGTLAEVLGPRALPIDREQRYYDVRDRAAAQWRRLPRRERDDVAAFARGVNAAMRVQPLPPEFRLLLYRPRPWTVYDSLAVTLAVSIALGDSFRDVLARDDVWRHYGQAGYDARFPLSDARYDVSVDGRHDAAHDRTVDGVAVAGTARGAAARPRIGSNAWAAGGRLTSTGRALLANDPHLELTIPGLWYLVDVRAPGMHVAGAAIPGVPGVVLGHNDRLAWGATNADVAATSVWLAGPARSGRVWARGAWRTERFAVRFGQAITARYYRAGARFGVPDPYRGQRLVLVRCAQLDGGSAIETFLSLDRARTIAQALRALSAYEGPAENFVIADADGRVAYQLAGAAIHDPAWGRYVHAASDPDVFPRVPFARLPARRPDDAAAVVSANNRMYGPNYPYRLAPFFDPPYRAYRIAELLRARRRYDVRYFERMQLDEVSAVDREFARRAASLAAQDADRQSLSLARELREWDGSFSPQSRVATLEHALRGNAEAAAPSLFAALEELRSGSVPPSLDAGLAGAQSSAEPWGRAGAVAVEHPLAPLHFGFLNGATLPGAGDEYTIRLQEPGFSQSFRAVWEPGNWDAGGISIPSGESGRPGSKHYRDLSESWIAGHMEPLPFSNEAIETATRATLTLSP